jgi:hypothetical protein
LEEGARSEIDSTSKETVTEVQKAIIRGNVKYPWGTVKEAKIAVGGRAVFSDSTGNYEVAALDPGSYTITAKAPFPGYEAPPQTVEAKAGQTVVVDVYLDFKKAIVEGAVYGQDGKPIVGATLSGVLSGKDMDSVTTDEKGHFRFEKVTPGDRFIRVNAPGYMGETRDFTAAEKETTTLEFHLTPAPCKIYGKIASSDGKPLAAEVLLLKAGIVVQKAKSDSQSGHYEFPAVPGRYEVLPMAQGYTPKGWSGDITADTKADFVLDPAPEMPPENQ